MNERIRELAEQAGFTANDEQKVFLQVYEQELKKFAELIIRECLSYAKDDDMDFMKFMIKRNFGVKV